MSTLAAHTCLWSRPKLNFNNPLSEMRRQRKVINWPHNFRCLIPQCDGSNPEYYTPWVLNAIPGTSPTSFENCERYPNSTITDVDDLNTCPAVLFDQSRTEECQGYVYENTNSVVYDVSQNRISYGYGLPRFLKPLLPYLY